MNTQTKEVFDFDLPQKALFKLSELEALGVMSVQVAKARIYDGIMKATKNGKTWIVPKSEVIRMLQKNWTGDAEVLDTLDDISELEALE